MGTGRWWLCLLWLCGYTASASALAAQDKVIVQDKVIQVSMSGVRAPENVYEYTLETPARTPKDGGWPVVFLFHGTAQSRSLWSEYTSFLGMEIPAATTHFKERLHAAGFATVAGESKLHMLPADMPNDDPRNLHLLVDREPKKYWTAWHVGDYGEPSEWRDPSLTKAFSYAERQGKEVDANPDLQFVVQLVAELRGVADANGRHLYNADDLYVAGFSNGGLFAMTVAQYLSPVLKIRAGAIASAGYSPAWVGEFNWHGVFPTEHPSMIVANTLGLDWVPTASGLDYKKDLIRGGQRACHYTRLGGTHSWPGVFDDEIIDLFESQGEEVPTNTSCLPERVRSED